MVAIPELRNASKIDGTNDQKVESSLFDLPNEVSSDAVVCQCIRLTSWSDSRPRLRRSANAGIAGMQTCVSPLPESDYSHRS